jgi:ferrous iron transport protein B
MNNIRRVALLGNPNTGKSTLFNALTGVYQRVGNYPGVTVEMRTGAMRHNGDAAYEIVDLPGAYSLAATAEDEAIVLDVLLGHEGRTRPDICVCVVDASNLSRNLFLASQVIELGRPVVVALNMIDVARRNGMEIDYDALARELGVPVVPLVASRGEGLDALRHAIHTARHDHSAPPSPPLPGPVVDELEVLTSQPPFNNHEADVAANRMDALQTLLGPGGFHERRLVERHGPQLSERLQASRNRICADGQTLEDIEARARYAWIDARLAGAVKTTSTGPTTSEKADRILTHRVWGTLVMGIIMALCFQALYSWSAPFMDLIDGFFGGVGAAAGEALPAGALNSLVVDGVVAGVGGVLIFLPQILMLFLFLAIMEDCGYMARAALLLDRWMGVFGLSGKSFFPLLSSFACAIPGIMATRSIENRRDRFLTILVAPLMTCSARLPLYVLLIAAFIPPTPLIGGWLNLQAVTLLIMYALGVVVAIPVSLVLRRFAFSGPPQSFLLELPSYKWPARRTVFMRMYVQGRAFVVTAGTLIFLAAIVIWALGYYPRPAEVLAQYESQRVVAAETHAGNDSALSDALADIDRNEAGALLRQSVLGRMGRTIEPAVKPLGWDWRIGTAAIAAFPARELVVATMGTIYNLGGEEDETSDGLRAKLQAATWPDGTPVYTVPVVLSLMVFFALCCQCVSTLAIIKREMVAWRWPIIAFVYMTGLAYIGALLTYQIATRLS